MVVFTGKLVEGADAGEVTTNLARLFKTDPARIGVLLSGKRFVIKKDLDEKTAKAYQLAIEKAGAVANVLEQTADEEPDKSGAANKAKEAPSEAPSLGPETAPAAETPSSGPGTVSATAGEMSESEPGEQLVEPEQVKEPSIDTSNLTLAEVGVKLAEARQVNPPQYDLSRLELAPLGENPTEPAEQPEAQFDTSHLTLS